MAMKNQIEISNLLLTGMVKGSDLGKEFASQEYLDKLFPMIADDPYIAVDVIEDFFKIAPNLDGNNISGFRVIRDVLFDICEKKEYINSFSLMAPHTHWEDRVPTVYHFDPENERYIIGPHQLEANAEYLPVTFVFTEMGPMPYEWAHPSVKLDKEEWKKAFDLVCELNSIVWSHQYPIGVNMDFRFKDSLFEVSKSSIELPINDSDPQFEDFSYITLKEDLMAQEEKEIQGNTKKKSGGKVVQVSWHPRSMKLYNFSNKEKDILDSFRNELDAMSDNERLSYIKKLEESLS